MKVALRFKQITNLAGDINISYMFVTKFEINEETKTYGATEFSEGREYAVIFDLTKDSRAVSQICQDVVIPVAMPEDGESQNLGFEFVLVDLEPAPVRHAIPLSLYKKDLLELN